MEVTEVKLSEIPKIAKEGGSDVRDTLENFAKGGAEAIKISGVNVKSVMGSFYRYRKDLGLVNTIDIKKREGELFLAKKTEGDGE